MGKYHIVCTCIEPCLSGRQLYIYGAKTYINHLLSIRSNSKEQLNVVETLSIPNTWQSGVKCQTQTELEIFEFAFYEKIKALKLWSVYETIIIYTQNFHSIALWFDYLGWLILNSDNASILSTKTEPSLLNFLINYWIFLTDHVWT